MARGTSGITPWIAAALIACGDPGAAPGTDPPETAHGAGTAAGSAPGAASQPGEPRGDHAGSEEDARHPIVDLDVEGHGRIRIELLPEKAPRTVASFLDLVAKRFFDGTTFHRIVPGFVIQGGDPNSKNRDPRDDGQGGPGYTLPDEPNDVSHRRGVVSMANRGRPNTGGSQFFILLADRPDLDGHYTAFGRVIDGMDVVDAIGAVEVDTYGRYGPPDRPRTNVVVSRVRRSDPPTPAP